MVKNLLAFVLVTAAGAIVWTATADWYERRKALRASTIALSGTGAAPGPGPISG